MTHGLYALQTLLRRRKIDGRSMLGQLLKQRRQEFVEHYGGADHLLPAPKGAILDRAMFKVTMLESIEHWALTQPGLIGEGGQLPSLLAKDYVVWSESMRRDLLALGLGRVVKDVEGDVVTAARRLAREQEARWSEEREADDSMGDGGRSQP